MSKQYLVTHTIEEAHNTDIFSLAVTPTQILSASGGSSLKLHSTYDADFPPVQTLKGAHKLGCHHAVTSKDGKRAASVGFGGEVRLWTCSPRPPGDGGAQNDASRMQAAEGSVKRGEEQWRDDGSVVDGNKAGEVWALALSEDGQYLASTTYDGRINVWDTASRGEKIRQYDTKGSFGMCIDLSADGRFTASGHENGGVYIFNNDSGRLLHSLLGLIKPARTVAFSPASKLLAAAGDATVIALYDVRSGEQVVNLTGHAAWIMSVDWNYTGEHLLSGSFDGKLKVWSTERRECVATHSEATTDKPIWSVKWLPPAPGSALPAATSTSTTSISSSSSSTSAAAAAAAPSTSRYRTSERFVVAGANRSISFYREATGG